jgi:glycosyltransferase involved in cell wall biosynthesis
MTKKIIHFHPNSVYSEYFVKPLIDSEEKLGYEVTLVNSLKSKGNQLNSNITREHIRFDLNLENLLLLPLSFIKVLILVKKIKPTYIVSHNIRSSLLPLLAGKVHGQSKLIYFNHGVSYLGHKGIIHYILKLIEYINCKIADHIIAVSKHAKQELLKLTKTNISVIKNGSACGIDLKIFSKKNNLLSNEIKQLKKNNDFLITFIGRPEKRKGFIFILELWEKYFINDKNIKLILCGTDIDINKYLKTPSTNIINMGNTNKISEILSLTDCLLLPSLHEGLPYSILEAMAMECPVIANNIPSIASQIKNKKNGYLIHGHNHEAYFKQINFIKNKSNAKSIKKITDNGLIEAKKFDRLKFLVSYNKKIKSILDDN